MYALLLVLCAGVAVNYKDVESIDPEYAKNLQVRMYVRMYVCMYVCTYVCMYARVYVHMCLHTYIHKYVLYSTIYMAMIQASSNDICQLSSLG